ncbi:MAG: hypothetical protein R2746_11115 [Acidimicrobiales bacterium]
MADDEVPPGEAVDDAEVRDVLPDDLDISEFVGPYVFPNNNRRRVPGYLYLLIGVGCLAAWAATGGDAVLVNDGYLAAGIAMVLIGAYHLVAGWNLDVDERDALVAATERVGFPVGHASAQLGWRGLRSRPTWRILLYSAENPPNAARPGVGGRRRRRDRGVVHRGEPRGLVGPRRRAGPRGRRRLVAGSRPAPRRSAAQARYRTSVTSQSTWPSAGGSLRLVTFQSAVSPSSRASTTSMLSEMTVPSVRDRTRTSTSKAWRSP